MLTVEMILGIILAGLLSDNYALLHFLGTGAVMENERSTKQSVVLGLGTTLVMLLTNAICWPLNTYLLEKVPYLQTMVFVLVVLIVVEILHIIAKKLLDNYCHADFVKFAINGAVLGLCIHNVHHSYLEAIITAAGIGIGFMLTMTLFAKLKDVPVDEDAIPASFRGLPIALLTAGMIVLALLALQFKF
jgi:electron transport complex protein RnfA